MPAKSLKHKFASAIADGADGTVVRPSNWNDDHNIFFGARTVTITTDTIADTDNLSLIQYNSGSAVAVTLPQAGAASQFLTGWTTFIRNRGAGDVTITPTTSTINETSSLVVRQNDYVILFSDGTNYAAIIARGPATAAPLANAQAAAVGTANRWAREDHVHSDIQIPESGRLTYVSATQIKFGPYKGNKLKLNGAIWDIPSAGITAANTAIFINGTGGQSLAANTTYFVYLFNNGGTLTVDFSTTTHATSTTAGNVGTEIKSGDDTRSLIGLIRTNASSQFADAAATRHVISWFNRRKIGALGASTNGATTTNTGAFVEIATAARASFLTWAEESVVLCCNGTASNSSTGNVCFLGCMIDGTLDTAISAGGCASSAAGESNNYMSIGFKPLAEGYHYLTPCSQVSGGTGTHYAYANVEVMG